MNFSNLISVIMLGFLSACVIAPQPIEDYTLARVAVDAARSVEGARHSPGYFHQAEESYRKALQYFEDREYEKAKIEFRRARAAAERAENSARLIRARSGEVF